MRRRGTSTNEAASGVLRDNGPAEVVSRYPTHSRAVSGNSSIGSQRMLGVESDRFEHEGRAYRRC